MKYLITPICELLMLAASSFAGPIYGVNVGGGGKTATNLLLNGSSIPMASGSTQTNSIAGTAATISVLSHSSNGVPVLTVTGVGYPLTGLTNAVVQAITLDHTVTNITYYLTIVGGTIDPSNAGGSYSAQDSLSGATGLSSPEATWTITSVDENGAVTGISSPTVGGLYPYTFSYINTTTSGGGSGAQILLAEGDFAETSVPSGTNTVDYYATNYYLTVTYGGRTHSNLITQWPNYPTFSACPISLSNSVFQSGPITP